ncbi:MAG: cyclic nucleotide-binding domain-containing protein [Thermoanaerobaculia bacterium]
MDPRQPHDQGEVGRAFPHSLEVPERTFSVEELKEFPILAAIPEGTLKKIQPYVLDAQYDSGDVVLREGDYSDAAYYIVSGVVEVLLTKLPLVQQAAQPSRRSGGQKATMHQRAVGLARTPARDRAFASLEAMDGTVILSDIPAELKSGDVVLLDRGEIFGEISALSRYPVSATVRARSAVSCLMIRTPALRLLQRAAPKFKEFVDRRYRDRTLASHLRRVGLFAACEERFLRELKDRVELVSFEPGQLIVEEGSAADAFYLVRGGYVKVSARSGAASLALTYLRKGDYFGEAAILLDEPWPFSFTAIDSVELVKLTRADFDRLLEESPAVGKQLWSVATERLKQRGAAIDHPVESEYLQMAMDTGLIHGESVLMIDLSTCTRCDDCVRACAETHGGIPRFIREGFKFKNWLVPTSCYQCTDPVCMIGCPTGAITRPIGTTEVSIDPLTCIGCGNCGRRCPWGNIINVPYSHPILKKEIQLATKCDNSIGRETPACVQACPHGSAIRVSFRDAGRLASLLPTVT